MNKLERLTHEQEAKMFEVRDFWKDYIFSCKHRTNQPAATAAITWLYNFSKLKDPMIIFVDSPMAVQYCVSYLKEVSKELKRLGEQSEPQLANVGANVWDNVRDNVWANVGANVGANVWDNVRDNVWANVGANVRDNVWANVWDNVWANVGANVRDNVWANVGDNVWANVGANVRDNVWANVGDNVWDNVRDNVWANVGDNVRDNVCDNVGDNYENFSSYGNIGDYGWVSFYDYFTQVADLKNDDFIRFRDMLLLGIYDMVQMENVCIVSNMPTRIVRNTEGRLHNPAGPAIEFADGYCQYYINGRSLPAWIWEKAAAGEITKDMFLREQNSEIKGGIYEVLGQKKMLDLLGAKEVDTRIITHRNGELETVTLLKTSEKFAEIDNQPFAWVKMVCPSTGTQYLQGVEPHHTNALEAIASLSPFKAQEYSFDFRS